MGNIQMDLSEYDSMKEKLNIYKERLDKCKESEDRIKNDYEERVRGIEKKNSEKLKEAKKIASNAIKDAKMKVVKTIMKKDPFIVVNTGLINKLERFIKNNYPYQFEHFDLFHGTSIQNLIEKNCIIKYSDSEVVETSYQGLDDVVGELKNEYDKLDKLHTHRLEVCTHVIDKLDIANVKLKKIERIVNKGCGIFSKNKMLDALKTIINTDD